MRYSRTFIFSVLLLTACGVPVTPTIKTAQQGSAASLPPVASQAPGASPTSIPPTVAPTQAPVPTLVPTSVTEPKGAPTPVPTPADKTIVVNEPVAGTAVNSPLTVRGETNFWPFEANLTAQIKDAAGNVLGIGPITVQAPDIGQGGPFEGQLTFTPPAQAQTGTLELFEASAKDGSIVVQNIVQIQLPGAANTGGLRLDSPADGTAVTLPLHVALRSDDPQAKLVARLRFANGPVLEQPLTMVTGADGVGYSIANVAWNTESAPPSTDPGNATFEIVNQDGTVLQQVGVRMLSENETQRVGVTWATSDGQLLTFKQAIGKGPQIASAALRELLNGPADGNLAGAETALPTVDEIVNFPGRTPDWGYEVKLIKLTIENGVATANFSKELRAASGGSARVQTIRQQIEQTLKQFPSVQQVVIQIEGESAGVLEP